MLQPRYLWRNAETFQRLWRECCNQDTAGELLNFCHVPRPWGENPLHSGILSAIQLVPAYTWLWYSRPPDHWTVVICHYIFTSWILGDKQASFGTRHLSTELHVSWSEQLELEELCDFLVMEDAEHYGWCSDKCIMYSSTSCGWCCSHSGIVIENQPKWY